MSGIVDMLGAALNQNTVGEIASQVGANQGQVQDAIGMAIPALLEALQRNASNPQGAQSLSTALQSHSGSILDNLAGFLGNVNQGPGAGILGHVFGNQQPVVQQGIGQAVGLTSGQMNMLFKILAPIVMGALGRAVTQQGANAGGLGNILGQATGQIQQQQPQAFNLIAMLLDQNHDGNVVDDLMRIVGNFLKK